MAKLLYTKYTSEMRFRQGCKSRRKSKRHGFWDIECWVKEGDSRTYYSWDREYQKWVRSDSDEFAREQHLGFSSYFDGSHSVRAFRKLLKKWSSYLPNGTVCVLFHPWYRDVIGFIRNKKCQSQVN